MLHNKTNNPPPSYEDFLVIAMERRSKYTYLVDASKFWP